MTKLIKIRLSRSQRTWATVCGAILVGLFLFAGCIQDQQYRNNFGLSASSTGLNLGSSVLRSNADYTLGFVEFDDQGWLWDPEQLKAITRQAEVEQKEQGLLIITFVHGWMHNASPEDDNVATFEKKMLRPLAGMEAFVSRRQHRPARRVVGIYAGWRGNSCGIPVLNTATFWNRKSAAERVGHGAAVELLCELERLRNDGNTLFRNEISNHQRMSSKLLIIGHSFGGDVVYSAVVPILIERMIETANGVENPTRGIGDLVVLINPAFEAARFETLHRLAAGLSSTNRGHCMLAIFTSKGDWATKIAFPAGRSVSMLGQSHRDGSQGAANRSAVGHYDPYVSFDLVVPTRPQVETGADDNKSGERVAALAEQIEESSTNSSSAGLVSSYRFTHCELQARTNCGPSNPVFVVSVDKNIIPDHGSIDRGVFTRFLAEFLTVFSEADR